MAYKTSLIIGPDGSTQSHVHSLMGCFALASTKDRSMFKLKSAIAEYFCWLRSHGEDVVIPTRPKLAVVQELRMRGSPGDAGGPDPLLRCDKVAASHENVSRCLRLLSYTREDLHQLLFGLSKEALDWKPQGEPRSLRNALRHIAQVDIWYLSRIDADPPFQIPQILSISSQRSFAKSNPDPTREGLLSTQVVRQALPLDGDQGSAPAGDARTTAHKLFEKNSCHDWQSKGTSISTPF